MREIKFRAWDEDFKYMNYKVLVGNIWDTDEKYTAHAMWIEPKYVSYKKEAGWCHFDEHSNIKLMQYTGLKDKNGVEIYEGDILAGCNGSINGTGWNWGNYSISFKDGKFDVPLWGTFEHYDSTHWFEVIGNIYENTELLEQIKCGS